MEEINRNSPSKYFKDNVFCLVQMFQHAQQQGDLFYSKGKFDIYQKALTILQNDEDLKKVDFAYLINSLQKTKQDQQQAQQQYYHQQQQQHQNQLKFLNLKGIHISHNKKRRKQLLDDDISITSSQNNDLNYQQQPQMRTLQSSSSDSLSGVQQNFGYNNFSATHCLKKTIKPTH